MAKRKRRPVALFEVISKSRQYNRPADPPAARAASAPASSLFSIPRGWFKRRPEASPAAETLATTTTAAAITVAPPVVERTTSEPAPHEETTTAAPVAPTAPIEDDDADYNDEVLDMPRAQTVHVA